MSRKTRLSALSRLCSFCIQIAMIFVYPYVIMPLFNKFTPLPTDSPVYPHVKSLAEKLNFPLGKVWVIDGSIRSSHSNAFFFGLPGLQKHIVLYDTLLEKSTPEEVEAILGEPQAARLAPVPGRCADPVCACPSAHELGHWKGMHVVYLLAVALTQVAVSFATYALFLENGALLSAFGFPPSASAPLQLAKEQVGAAHASTGPTIVALLLAMMLFSPLSSFLQFVTNSITRRLEYDADAFATKLGASYATNLKKALVTIHEKNLVRPPCLTIGFGRLTNANSGFFLSGGLRCRSRLLGLQPQPPDPRRASRCPRQSTRAREQEELEALLVQNGRAEIR